MDNRIPTGRNFQFSPTRVHSSRQRYLAELLAEKQKLDPFGEAFPVCCRLLYHEIMQTTSQLISNQSFGDHERIGHEHPFRLGQQANGGQMNFEGWSSLQTEYNLAGRILGPRGNSLKRFEQTTGCRVWVRGRGSKKSSIEEEKLKDKPGYEHLNEPLHLLVVAEFPEDIIDSHLNHAVAMLENLMNPVDGRRDNFLKQHLRELTMLNGAFREESPSMSPR